jgi:Methyl-accepting chemotaxis protein
MLLAVSAMGIYAINAGNQSLDALNRIQGIELNKLYQSRSDLMRARANAALAVRKIEIGLLDDGAKVTQQAQAAVDSSHQFLKAFVDAGTVTAHGKTLADAIVATYNVYDKEGITPMMDALKKQYTDEYYQVLEGKQSQLAANYSKAVNDFSIYADEVSAARLKQAADNEVRMKVMIGVVMVLTLLLIVLAWQLLRRSLLRPLDNAILHLEQIAAGDLSQPLPAAGKNEIGRLNQALSDMQLALRDSVSQVREASMQIDVGSRELAAGTVHLSQRTEESAASLEQTAASMEQLTATVRLNASNAQQANQLGQQCVDQRRSWRRGGGLRDGEDAGDHPKL